MHLKQLTTYHLFTIAIQISFSALPNSFVSTHIYISSIIFSALLFPSLLPLDLIGHAKPEFNSMGTCLSKKKGSSSTPSPGTVTLTKSATTVSTPAAELKNSANGVSLSRPKVKTEEEVNLKKKNSVQENDGLVKKEIFIIKHRKSHDDNRDRNPKCSPVDGVGSNATSEAAELITSKKILVPEASGTMGLGVRTSSCTKEEVDAILIHCGKLSRSSSGKAASSSAAASGGRKYSGSKRSYDFDHCDNDTTSADDDQRKINKDFCEDDEKSHQHRQRHRQSPRKPSSPGRRRTPSRERDQNQRSSSRERRVSRSPGRRSSETSSNVTTNGAASAINGSGVRPGKMVSVPATVSSLAMDKSNNGGVGGESATSTGIRRISVKRNVGDNGGMAGSRSAASPRSQSPARANGNAKVFGDNQIQQQPSLSRNSSRKAEHSPYRRNPLSEIDPNSLAYPQLANNNSHMVQKRNKGEIETEANQKPNTDMNDNNKNTSSNGVRENFKTKEQLQEDDGKGQSLMTENIVVKTVVSSGFDNPKPQTLTRSRSSRRSRDLDFNPEALLNPGQSYTSLLLEDIQNFHQKNVPSVSLPACVTKACSILEAVADLNSTTGPNLSGAAFSGNRSPPIYQSFKNEFNTPLDANNRFTKKVMPDTKDPFVESEVVVCDDVMEPSFHKYVTVRRGGSLGGLDSEDQESSGSNSYTVSSQQHSGTVSSSSWEPNSADSRDSWISRSNSREEGLKSPLGLQASFSSQADCDIDEGKKNLNGKRSECNHQHSSGIGRGRLGDANKGLHTLAVATAAVST